MAAYRRGSTPNLSMREKTLHKRIVTKEHNSNFRAGYVHVNEEYLHKTGIRGRKRYVVYAVLIFMAVLAIVNILVTLTIMGVLKIGKDGMATLEFIPRGVLLRLLGDSGLGEVSLVENVVFSLPDHHMELSGIDNQPVHLHVGTGDSTLTVSTAQTSINNTAQFRVIDPDTGKNVFTTDFSQFKFPDETQSVALDETSTNRIVSPNGKDLSLESETITMLRGAEGITADGRQFVVSAKNDIDITTGQHLLLDGKSVYLDQVNRVATAASNPTQDIEASYRLCVCMPSGRIFAVPAPFGCNQANEQKNPCTD